MGFCLLYDWLSVNRSTLHYQGIIQAVTDSGHIHFILSCWSVFNAFKVLMLLMTCLSLIDRFSFIAQAQPCVFFYL